jgi:hypothetical protein
MKHTRWIKKKDGCRFKNRTRIVILGHKWPDTLS